MKKTIKAWAVFHPDLGMLFDTIREKKADSTEQIDAQYYSNWSFLHDKLGYRIRRISITVED